MLLKDILNIIKDDTKIDIDECVFKDGKQIFERFYIHCENNKNTLNKLKELKIYNISVHNKYDVINDKFIPTLSIKLKRVID